MPSAVRREEEESTRQHRLTTMPSAVRREEEEESTRQT